MQSRSLKLRKNYPKHGEFAIAPLDPNTSYARILEFVGERKKVLDVGCGNGYLASLFLKSECDVVGIDANPLAAEEARKYCTSVLVSDLDETVISELLDGRQFDAIVFADVLEHLHEPARTLDESRALLSERGYVVASIPNISHGAIRLALLSGRFDYQELGILDDSHLRFFTAKTIDELFLTAGFRVETVDRVTLPLFADSDLVPVLDPRDFDEKAVAKVKADPDSETLQFVVKAFPLSNDQRLRTISKRFLTANTELTATKQQAAHRESELEALRAVLQSHEAATIELRDQTRRAQRDLEASRDDIRQLEDANRGLELEALAKENAALERSLATQAEEARLIETIADLQSKVDGAERLRADALARGELDVEARESLERASHALQEQLERERQRASAAEAELHASRGDAAERKLQLEARLHAESQGKERLSQELAVQRAQVLDLSRRSQELHAGTLALEERLREKSDLSTQPAALHSIIEALDAEVAITQLELSRSRSEFQAQRQLLYSERQAFSDKIARTESDCDELLTEAVTVVDAVRLQMESEQCRLEARHREDGATTSELEAQLAAIRKAAIADKLVMRQYADDFRRQAEGAQKELHGAIRQRDDLYLRVVDNDRIMRESAENNTRLDEQVRQLEARLDEEYARTVRAERELVQSETMVAEHTARSEATIAELRARSKSALEELTASSESTIAQLSARASSLENDLAHQQAVLQHLRETTESERGRADAAAAELSSLTVRYEILQGRLGEMDNLLVAQTEHLLASTSDERERLLTLIDTVQSSHFWRVKHLLARLRARIFGRAPARGA